MKKIILAAGFLLLASSSSFAAGAPICTPVKQNWVNGSGTTCTYDDTTQSTTRYSTPAPTPDKPYCHGEGGGEWGGTYGARGRT